MRTTPTLLLLLALSGCGSSPQARFFTLSVAGEPPPSGRTLSQPVQIAAVHIPDTLDRREMVSAAGPNQVQISDQDRWSADLGPMTRRVLSQDLASHFGPGAVIPPQAPVPPDTRLVVVTLEQFGRQADGRVTLVGNWTLLRHGSDRPVRRRDIRLDAPSGPDSDQIVAAMSRLLSSLAAQIATAIPHS